MQKLKENRQFSDMVGVRMADEYPIDIKGIEAPAGPDYIPGT